jgi:hypothetical protein
MTPQRSNNRQSPEADFVKSLYESCTMIFVEDVDEGDRLSCAVLAGPTGPALSDLHTSARAAWKQVALAHGYVALPTSPSRGRLLMFPSDRRLNGQPTTLADVANR